MFRSAALLVVWSVVGLLLLWCAGCVSVPLVSGKPSPLAEAHSAAFIRWSMSTPPEFAALRSLQ